MSETVQAAILRSAAVLERMAADADACATIEAIVDTAHWAGELVARFMYDRPGLAAIALTTDSSILTAVGNDYGYDYGFARQVEALGRPGDMLFAISTSGRSANVLAAARAAKTLGMSVAGFTGEGGGPLAELADHCLRIPSGVTPQVQEAHEVAGHIICATIESRMFPRPA
ncbi:MAG: SIS domain-containing protein [Acetobacteraceae bacterium]|nr:MAG: SIS domain-containing protein [Acetobacteraceae bacterium]